MKPKLDEYIVWDDYIIPILGKPNYPAFPPLYPCGDFRNPDLVLKQAEENEKAYLTYADGVRKAIMLFNDTKIKRLELPARFKKDVMRHREFGKLPYLEKLFDRFWNSYFADSECISVEDLQGMLKQMEYIIEIIESLNLTTKGE